MSSGDWIGFAAQALTNPCPPDGVSPMLLQAFLILYQAISVLALRRQRDNGQGFQWNHREAYGARRKRTSPGCHQSQRHSLRPIQAQSIPGRIAIVSAIGMVLTAEGLEHPAARRLPSPGRPLEVPQDATHPEVCQQIRNDRSSTRLQAPCLANPPIEAVGAPLSPCGSLSSWAVAPIPTGP
jgi:hypothetical protein